jgi:hypothetical protein
MQRLRLSVTLAHLILHLENVQIIKAIKIGSWSESSEKFGRIGAVKGSETISWEGEGCPFLSRVIYITLLYISRRQKVAGKILRGQGRPSKDLHANSAVLSLNAFPCISLCNSLCF